MLITLINVIGCENPDCRDFARITPALSGTRSYYCPICGFVSAARAIDANLTEQPQAYEVYLRRIISAERPRVLDV